MVQHPDGSAGLSIRVAKSTGFNDIEVADDGTVYATQTGAADRSRPDDWQVWQITRDGNASIFVQGAPLRQPNGVAFDSQGNIVVVNIGNGDVHDVLARGQADANREGGADRATTGWSSCRMGPST